MIRKKCPSFNYLIFTSNKIKKKRSKKYAIQFKMESRFLPICLNHHPQPESQRNLIRAHFLTTTSATHCNAFFFNRNKLIIVRQTVRESAFCEIARNLIFKRIVFICACSSKDNTINFLFVVFLFLGRGPPRGVNRS